MTPEELQSKSIYYLRFPLIVGVVLIHSNLSTIALGGTIYHFHNSYWYYAVIYLFSEVIPRICVPLFFLISGFMFFKGRDFTLGSYKEKLKKRVKSLLIPYLFWNLLALGVYSLKHSSLMIGVLPAADGLKTNGFLWFLSAFWSFGGDSPADLPFWFLRDLMVVVIFSPLIKWLIDKLKIWFILLLGIMWVVKSSLAVPGVSITAFFFFSAGAYMSLTSLNLSTAFKRLFAPSAILYPLFVFADVFTRRMEFHQYIHDIGILIGMVLVLNLVAYLMENNRIRVNTYLAGTSFFVYAFHGFLVWDLIKVIFVTLRPRSEVFMILIYFIVPVVVIGVCLLVYNLLRKFVPKFLEVIIGGR